LLPSGTAEVVQRYEDCVPLWDRGIIPVIDAHAFAVADEGQVGCLPHCWSVTSDSVAARIARVCGASELILLKSVSLPPENTWTDASAEGIVDGYFPSAVRELSKIRVINFRET